MNYGPYRIVLVNPLLAIGMYRVVSVRQPQNDVVVNEYLR